MRHTRAMRRKSLRKEKLAERDELGSNQRQRKSQQIQNLLTEQPVFANARHLFVYVHFRSEVETLPLIEHCLAQGKTISVPVTLRNESRLLAVQITDPATKSIESEPIDRILGILAGKVEVPDDIMAENETIKKKHLLTHRQCCNLLSLFALPVIPANFPLQVLEPVKTPVCYRSQQSSST